MRLSFNWLNDYYDSGADAGEVAEKLTMSGLEVENVEHSDEFDDYILTVEVTSNRPDWLSHIGVAREIAAIYGGNIKYPEITASYSENSAGFCVSIENKTKSPYYSALLLEDVSFGESPDFIRKRLLAAGMRPINLPVDLTNYVLLEYGQPMHVFDYDKLNGGIYVRDAREGEIFKAINDKEYTLSKDDLVIADEDGPIALAGIMGGKDSEVGMGTKNILLEVALFGPVGIRRSSRKHQLTSDSSYRFERRVNPGKLAEARSRFIYLFLKYGFAGSVSEVKYDGEIVVDDIKVGLEKSYVKRTLGTDIPKEHIVGILNSLELNVGKDYGDRIEVHVPSHRSDITRPIDLVEEVARIYGYDKIEETYPLIAIRRKKKDLILEAESAIREKLSAMGLCEVITFSLENREIYDKFAPEKIEGAVSVINPSNKKLTLMRPSLLNGMLDAVKTNINHWNKDIRFFEVARVYKRNDGSEYPDEKKVCSIALSGVFSEDWNVKKRNVTFFDLKGVVESMLKMLKIKSIEYVSGNDQVFSNSVNVFAGGVCIGGLGVVKSEILDYYDIKQDVFYAELEVEPLRNILKKAVIFKDYPKYPPTFRDLSVLVGKAVKLRDIIDTIRRVSPDLIADVKLFDLYEGKQIEAGFKSVSVSIRFQSYEKTLESAEVDSLYDEIVRKLDESFEAKLRP